MPNLFQHFAQKLRRKPIEALPNDLDHLTAGHALTWSCSRTKYLSFVASVLEGQSGNSDHSLSIFEHNEAEFVLECMKATLGDSGKILYVDVSAAPEKEGEEDPLVLPVSAIKMALQCLVARQQKTDNSEEHWHGPTISLFRALLPYVEALYTCEESIPGVDITDTACIARVERRVPVSELIQSLQIESIKAWLSLHPEADGWQPLYRWVCNLPGCESLLKNHPEEMRIYGFTSMVGFELIKTIAKDLPGLVESLADLRSALEHRNRHVIVRLPVWGYPEDRNDIMAMLYAEVRSTLGTNLGSELASTQSIVEQPPEQFRGAMFVPCDLFPRHAVRQSGVFYSQLRALGWRVFIDVDRWLGISDDLSLITLMETTSDHVVPDCQSAVVFSRNQRSGTLIDADEELLNPRSYHDRGIVVIRRGKVERFQLPSNKVAFNAK